MATIIVWPLSQINCPQPAPPSFNGPEPPLRSNGMLSQREVANGVSAGVDLYAAELTGE